MGGEGSMLHAINTIRANRALRGSKRRKFRNKMLRLKFQNSSKRNINSYKKDISKEDLEKVKNQIRLQIIKDQEKSYILSIIFLCVFVLILSYFWTYIF